MANQIYQLLLPGKRFWAVILAVLTKFHTETHLDELGAHVLETLSSGTHKSLLEVNDFSNTLPMHLKISPFFSTSSCASLLLN